MRFGLFIPQGWRHDLVGIDPADQWRTVRDLAQHADDGPWESVWVYDHFHTVPVVTEEATHEAWTLMAAFAAATSRVRLGQMCTCMSYRNPAHLAKIATTVDIVSGGRVEMGIGGGWYEHEWRAYGYGFPPIAERLGRLDEGLQIMRQAWTEGVATLDGRWYQVDGAVNRPLPLQQGGIPLWVAGGGEKVTLRIAAQYAQYTNFAGAPEAFDHKSAVLRGHCDRLGTDYAAITRSSNYNVMIAETEAEVEKGLQRLEERVTPALGAEAAAAFVAEYRGPDALAVGTPAQIVDRLGDMRERGMDYAITYFPDAAYDRSGIELFERDVVPHLS
ncbi:LLM class F420-dependent oxidoreductase [Rathayibacter sp. VKM Ac-2856]|uniref:LLM class F420-dependent oxidoreductase n=1 Tax=unclassified Rathayibacter TaxID=2609250 RepID=UPI001565CAA8|nr:MULTISPECIES: LLM class F420-dependent oxidoreductase [unclassified Rathayibacter]NQX04528.1 LLM class F420-dependent oxidoreductase [Rathayibacter sp. VKM Ac-2858]NQX19697.1 LLM class F420-dependent oxidoreductase [Rathayibacter sp. VKM Ac-2856]